MIRTTRFAAIAIAAITLAACQQQAPATVTEPAAAPAVQSDATPAPASAPTVEAAAEGQGISRIVAIESIGATKEFLERTLGQSTYETPQEARYTASGCDVSVSFGEDKAVSQISIALKPGCRFDASKLANLDAPLVIDGPLTFAQFEKLFGQAHYTSPCLTLCGNAYDPYVDAVVGGVRANGMIDVSAHAIFVEDPVLEAVGQWRDKLQTTKGEDYVMNTKFNCERDQDAIPSAAFANVQVEAFQFGREIGSSDCG